MDEAAVGQHNHLPVFQPDGAHLLQHGLIVLHSRPWHFYVAWLARPGEWHDLGR